MPQRVNRTLVKHIMEGKMTYKPGQLTHTGEVWMTPVWQLTLANKTVETWRGVGNPPGEWNGVAVIDHVQVV